MAGVDEEYSVSHQLVQNLECLGFDLHATVLKKVPARGLPPRYSAFKVAPDMFNATNSAAAEVVLFYIFEHMPWDAVAECLPMLVDLGAEDRRAVKNRLVENARHHFAELAMCFPCVELNQLTAYKKQAAALLELLKHLLPSDTGHARRLLTEAGHRLAWVCMRLTSYLIQYHATGGIDPVAITGGADTPVRRRVLQAQVVREALRFQNVAKACVKAEKQLTAAAARISGDLAAAKAKMAHVKAAAKEQPATSPEDVAPILATEAPIKQVIDDRKAVLDTIDRIYSSVPDVEAVLGGASKEQLNPAALEATWREARAAAGAASVVPEGVTLAHYVAQHAHSAGGVPRGDGILDLGDLGRVWQKKIERLGAPPPARRGGGAANPRNGGAAALDLDAMVAACEAQVAPLTTLVAALKSQNDEVEGQLRPKLEAELARLEVDVGQHPLSCLMPPIDPSCIPGSSRRS
eukprot:TRINITY_DN30658_c0_g1_i1.p1 TRINITY_DN30658_c0_g1~~TRINITY_DN30658_c0_g1_i1.p1  ORF type:complete len:464 (+),score=163.54 TRINITY_DN30658_c0_g1_i1:66-1457(+)